MEKIGFVTDSGESIEFYVEEETRVNGIGSVSYTHLDVYKRQLREATRTLADILKAKEKEIYFTSGGTESNNWALYLSLIHI